jgi:hypothetical protein
MESLEIKIYLENQGLSMKNKIRLRPGPVKLNSGILIIHEIVDRILGLKKLTGSFPEPAPGREI